MGKKASMKETATTRGMKIPAKRTATKKKRAATKSRKGASASSSALQPGHATVRMYNNILGDCFLIRFPAGNSEVKILVDCGVLQGMHNATKTMREIATDIGIAAKGYLDVVVATHEHVDHLSGFAQAQDIFDRIEIGELWLAWTEDDRDPEAAKIRDRRRKALGLLVKLDRHFNEPEIAEEDEDHDEEESVEPQRLSDNTNQILAFTEEAHLCAVAGGGRMTTGEILDYLKGRARKIRYCVPGSDPIDLPREISVQAYALGPPKDEELLKRSNPRKGEVYLLGETDSLAAYLAAAIQLDKSRDDFNSDEERQFAMAMPFDAPHRRRLSTLELNTHYFDPRYQWRQIDRDWLRAAEQLALKLDSDTNNTSLVLAFVAGQGANRRVMLFPGDAQVGNWISWQQYVWPKGSKRGERDSIDIAELLASTVLYKVGHHASYNATLRAAGLELMTHPELTAMIPVNEEFARGTKRWNMPFPALLAHLAEKTKGRVFRADKSRANLAAEGDRRANGAGEMRRKEWDEFLDRIVEGPPSKVQGNIAVYVEYTIPFA